jgi:hypothetical protein
MPVPYIVGSPIKKPSNFYGMHELVARLADLIDGRQPQSVSLLGLKRSGKTSLMYYIAHPSVLAQHVVNPDAYVTLYVDFSVCDTPAMFYRQVYQGLLHRLSSAPASEQEKVTNPDSEDIHWLLRRFPVRRVLLLLDEVDHLTQGAFDQSFLLQLRALAGAQDTELAYITASFHNLDQIGGSLGLPSTSPFYNIFYPSYFYLSGLSKAEGADLIRRPAEQEGIVFSDEEVENIQAMAGTLPFLIQMSACKWFLGKRDKQSLTPEQIQRELVGEANPFFERWWRDLGEENHLLLREIAQKGSISVDDFQNPIAEEILRFLKRYGLVIEEKGTLHINGSVLATWILERIAEYREEHAVPDFAEIEDTEKVRIIEDGKPLRNQVFFSYSHKDRRWLEKLQIWLKPVMRNDMLWDDTKIVSGAKWKDEIQKSLESAKIGVLLVSQDFLASDFIQNHELPPLLKAAEEEGLTILWIPITHSTYEYTDIAQFQAVHDPSRPLNSLTGASLERALVAICDKIKSAAE